MIFSKSKISNMSISVIDDKPDSLDLLSKLNNRQFKLRKLKHGEIEVGFASSQSTLKAELTEANALRDGLMHGRVVIAKGAIPPHILKSTFNQRCITWMQEAEVDRIPPKVKKQIKEEVIIDLCDMAITKVSDVSFVIDLGNDLLYASCPSGSKLDVLQASMMGVGLSSWPLNTWNLGVAQGACSEENGSLFLLYLLHQIKTGEIEAAAPTVWSFVNKDDAGTKTAVLSNLSESKHTVRGAFQDDMWLHSLDLAVVCPESAWPFVTKLDADWNLRAFAFPKDCSDGISRKDHLLNMSKWLRKQYVAFCDVATSKEAVEELKTHTKEMVLS